MGQARNHLRCLSKSRESLRSTNKLPDQSLSLHGTAAAQALPSLSLGNNKLFPSRGLRSITKRTHRLSEKRKRKTSEPISTIELTFHFPRDLQYVLYAISVLRVTWDGIFCEVFSPSQKSGREKHGKQIHKQTNLRKFLECHTDFLHEVTNLSQWSQITEKTNEFSTVGGFSLTFPTLGYQSVTHYIPESFHYAVILWAIHSFNINIHESKNQLHMILSMIFLINIRRNVN